MPALKVLIANATLATLTGTETYVRDLALGLLRKGHSPIVYAPRLGEIAQQLRRATIPVVDDLSSISTTPDIIHGNHNTELITALLHFANIPAVFFCHSWTDWVSSPPMHPRILRYVAVGILNVSNRGRRCRKTQLVLWYLVITRINGPIYMLSAKPATERVSRSTLSVAE
jgi:hypothetical protein